ncbi:hypothetical protein PSEUBRA_005358 [Kalmanozyma brasiliensis GHG001]|uniref:Uncharacterized protein n=1 Tax=Kalmanozyma brasiliensis (strain GHG001) TaxID=1365824 RepID=V5ERU8_KALBG|nr:uncharacterized protein PSEUBRA_005358 [Kalmanozyma brasiliensis GHG001]EST05653.1 hypothetical protein PSEUBRA_005358 [Kalmanozyma brasiliensis GHG001]
MCISDILSAPETATKPIMIEYKIRISEKEEYIKTDASSCTSSTETLTSPPVYEAKPPTTVTISSPRTKSTFFGRIFSRKTKKSSSPRLPSYREAEIAEAWAKVGIDVNNRKHGPRPKCTPEELLEAMDGLFGSRTPSKATA